MISAAIGIVIGTCFGLLIGFQLGMYIERRGG